MIRSANLFVANSVHELSEPFQQLCRAFAMSAPPSTEQRELQLVESVEFKILGVANKEDKLHQLLQRYLAPLILKAASEHASVRARVRIWLSIVL